MASTLVALFGPKRGVRLTLDGPTVVGRASTATLQLIDGKVSREHCRFLIEGPAVVVEDLGSQNGTFVNGAALLGRRVLAAGDEIAVGDSLFLLDPDFAVLAARYGDATLVVAGDTASIDGGGAVEAAVAIAGSVPSGGAPAPVVADGAPAGEVALAVAALARALGAAPDAERAVEALLVSAEGCLRPDRVFVLAAAPERAGAGADDGGGSPAALRVLGGRARARRERSGPGAGEATPERAPDLAPVLARAVLAAAAQRRAPITLASASEERTRGDRRSVVARAPRALLVAPFVSGDAVTGFLYLDRRAERPFSAVDRALAGALAAVAALQRLGGALAAPPAALPAPDAVASAPVSAGAVAGGPVGGSAAFARVRHLATAAARTTSTVLITGDSGTGKEEIARHIHRLGGHGPFVAVNCGAIPEALAESELFGHERGAFTGAVAAREGRIEAADGGTLFLDEVGELSPALQVKLLRVLQERIFQRVGSTAPRSVDLRVIAATHRRLEADVAGGRFREDLFYRLNVVRIAIPPLRERREDIAPLAVALLARVAARLGRVDPGLAPATGGWLERAAWPGNARELANVLERVLVLREPHERGPVGPDEIALAMGDAPPIGIAPPPVAEPRPVESQRSAAPTAAGRNPSAGAVEAPAALPGKVAALERAEILTALRAARGVKARAARQLGISRPTLDKKMGDLGIDLWGGDDASDGGGGGAQDDDGDNGEDGA